MPAREAAEVGEAHASMPREAAVHLVRVRVSVGLGLRARVRVRVRARARARLRVRVQGRVREAAVHD